MFCFVNLNLSLICPSLVKICLENLVGREGGRYQIVFLGDSRMRQIYKALVRLVANGSEPQDYASETEKEHRTLSFQHGHLAIDFHWAPGPEDIIDAVRKLIRSTDQRCERTHCNFDFLSHPVQV